MSDEILILPASNSGIHAGTGFEFQKHCALYLLLDNYGDWNSKNYFISIESYDDFMFCFFDSDNINYELIQTYQAKKSSATWSLTAELYVILNKIKEAGLCINKELTSRNISFAQENFFVSNSLIKLDPDNKGKKKENKESSIKINETNSIVKYSNLSDNLKDKILNGLKSLSDNQNLTKEDISSLSFMYIDLAKTFKNQKENLIGKISEIFGKQVQDHSAAYTALLDLFRGIELSFNQGNKLSFGDPKKILTSKTINDAFNIITTQSKAFEFWRSHKDLLAPALLLPKKEHQKFESDFNNAFDLFKDMNQVEHKKIYDFVAMSFEEVQLDCYTDHDCILKILTKYNEKNSTFFEDVTLKAIIYAAYFEVSNKNDN